MSMYRSVLDSTIDITFMSPNPDNGILLLSPLGHKNPYKFVVKSHLFLIGVAYIHTKLGLLIYFQPEKQNQNVTCNTYEVVSAAFNHKYGTGTVPGDKVLSQFCSNHNHRKFQYSVLLVGWDMLTMSR